MADLSDFVEIMDTLSTTLYETKQNVNIIQEDQLSTHVTAEDLNNIKTAIAQLAANINQINKYLINLANNGNGNSNNSSNILDIYKESNNYIQQQQLVVDGNYVNDSVVYLDQYYVRVKNIFIDGYKMSYSSPYNLVSWNQFNNTIRGFLRDSNKPQNGTFINIVPQYNENNVITGYRVNCTLKGGTDIQITDDGYINYTGTGGSRDGNDWYRYGNAASDTSLTFNPEGGGANSTNGGTTTIAINTDWLTGQISSFLTRLDGNTNNNYVLKINNGTISWSQDYGGTGGDGDHAYKYTSGSDASIKFASNNGYNYATNQTANQISVNPDWLKGTTDDKSGYNAIYSALTSIIKYNDSSHISINNSDTNKTITFSDNISYDEYTTGTYIQFGTKINGRYPINCTLSGDGKIIQISGDNITLIAPSPTDSGTKYVLSYDTISGFHWLATEECGSGEEEQP